MAEQVRMRLKDVNKVIGGRTIVKDLSLDLYAGEVFGLIGPNGAGKTTTIRMMTGLSDLTSGDIEYEGRSYRTDFTEIKSKIGCIVENPDLYEYMSGWEQLKLYSAFYPEVTEARLKEVVSFVKMEQAIHKKSKNYSLGMKQRVALALSLIHSPEVLILDEPTNGLDPQGIRELRLLLRELAEKQNVTVLVSSHILWEMQALCDRVGLIHLGELIETGKVSEIMSRMDGNTVAILCNDPHGLQRFFTERQIGATLAQDYVKVSCEREHINAMLEDLIEAGFMIYEIMPDRGSLEESFISLVEQKGGKIQ